MHPCKWLFVLSIVACTGIEKGSDAGDTGSSLDTDISGDTDGDTDSATSLDTGDSSSNTDTDIDNDTDSDTDTDNSSTGVDGDGDGYSQEDGDCDDNDASVNPGAEERGDDLVDQDCDGWLDPFPSTDTDTDTDTDIGGLTCELIDCGPPPPVAMLCPDGFNVVGFDSCEPDGSGGCEWVMEDCPETDTAMEECSLLDCGVIPPTVAPYLCPDGMTWSGMGECVMNALGHCVWEYSDCDLDDTGDSDVETENTLEVCYPAASGDDYTLWDGMIVGDSLLLTVEYLGGCADHAFQLCWEGVWPPGGMVEIHTKLHHDANGDMCANQVIDTQSFDLSEVRELYQSTYGVSSGMMMIHIEGFAIEYFF